MYCPRCQETLSSFQTLCPTCFGELQSVPGLEQGLRRGIDGFMAPVLDELLEHSMENQHMPQMPRLDLPGLGEALLGKPADALAQDLFEGAGTALAEPRRIAEKGAEQASGQVRRAARQVTESAAGVERKLRAGTLAPGDVQSAYREIGSALEEATRELQALAASTREEVLAALRQEGARSKERAALVLRARREDLQSQLGRRLEDLQMSFARISRDLEPEARQSLQQRLVALRNQVDGALQGLEKQVGALPEPVQRIVRQTAAGEPLLVQETLTGLVEPARQSAAEAEAKAKAGCLTFLAVFASFVLPGLGQFVLGKGGAGMVLLALYIVGKAFFPDSGALPWLLSGAAAVHVLTQVNPKK